MIEWTTDPDVRRRALVGLNKGEAHHAPSSAPSTSTNAANCGTEPARGSTNRVAGLQPLATIIIYWNTLKLGDATFARRQAGLGGRSGASSASSPL